MLSFLLDGEAAVVAINWAPIIGGIGVALTVLLCGLGSAIGLKLTGTAAAAVLTEKPKKSGDALLLAVLPATQGIYGFVLGLINYNKIVALTGTQGWSLFIACLPLMIVGMLSAILQGATSVSGLKALAKSDLSSGKLILYPAMVETYAILALVVSIMMTGNVG